jgi:RNA methyltransferase, TrmH family
MKVETLTSAKNPLIKGIRRAIVRGALTDEGLAVAESFHLLEEALRSECRIEAVLAAESIKGAVANRVRGLDGIRVFAMADALFRELASTETPQGVIALVRPPSWTLDQALRGQALTVVLDGLQEPGNAGAILRAAEAFGASGAVFLKGAVNPYNSKAMRASAGSIFRLPCVQGLDEAVLHAALEQKGITLYAALPASGAAPASCDLKRKTAFVIGSEGRGVSSALSSKAVAIRIPTVGVESLNAAVAAGILLYEARRQRTHTA